MYKHILVPTDGSPLSLKAAREAAGLAKILGAKLTALFVSTRFYPPIPSETLRPTRMDALQAAYQKATDEEAAKALRKVESVALSAKVACETAHETDDRPWSGIIAAAKKRKCDLIVMASHGRGSVTGLLLGSETTKVLAHSKVPVLVCR